MVNEYKGWKRLGSIPVILIALYFAPILGICLLIFRSITYSAKKNRMAFLLLLGSGIVLWIINFMNIPNLSLEKEKIEEYGKLLIMVSIISITIFQVLERVFHEGKKFIRDYIQNEEERKNKIYEQNNLKVQEKQEKAKHTSVVYCPYCGADNILTEAVGTCKYCRRKIKNNLFR